jgi:hypothetical protein
MGCLGIGFLPPADPNPPSPQYLPLAQHPPLPHPPLHPSKEGTERGARLLLQINLMGYYGVLTNNLPLQL